jgi:hypothetical protein
MSGSHAPQTTVPSGLLVASPLAFALAQWTINRDDAKRQRELYGGGTTKAYVIPSTGAVMLGVLVGVLLFCFFGIVPLGRAFNCGPLKTTIGFSGTSWGLIILILWLFCPPLGVVFGAIYLFGGKCIPPPIMMPVSPYPSVPLSYTSPSPFGMPLPRGPY